MDDGFITNGLPAYSCKAVMIYLLELLDVIRAYTDSYSDEDNPSVAPAAIAQVLFNGYSTMRLPSREVWLKAYKADKNLTALSEFVDNLLVHGH